MDDVKQWRDQVRTTLQARPEWKIVAETGDGAEAVQKATELQPDIILLDIGLPKLNGIEAARMIRQRSPKSRIIFLTQNRDKEIMDAALSIGRTHYILKANAAHELLDAIATALHNP